MGRWVRVCGAGEAPVDGNVMEVEISGTVICLARVGGELSALDNVCPHRQGPLGQGWIEGTGVVCPWHSWVFNARTGVAEYPDNQRVAVFPVKEEAGDVLVALEGKGGVPV